MGTGIASAVPVLLTMSLLGIREFVQPASPATPSAHPISQGFQAPPAPPTMPQLFVAPEEFITYSTASFKDPSFNNEESLTTANANCEYASNHNYDNVIGYTHTRVPHGFQLDPNFESTQNNQLESYKKEKNVHALQKGKNLSNLIELSKLNHENKIYESERFFSPDHTFKSPPKSDFNSEYAGPAMELVFYWKTVDYEFEHEEDRKNFIYSGTYIPENNLPLGVEVWKDRVFISLPRWKKGIPATLTTVSTQSFDKSPKLRPYPNWRWHHLGYCQGLTSVFRMQVDECDRLWVLDSGKIDIIDNPQQICPPTIYIFNLYTDELIKSYELPKEQIKEDSLYANIIVDIKDNQCEKAVAYAADVWRFGLIVYDFSNHSSFRIQHHFFYPDPLSSRYNVHGVQFDWTDGLFGIALTPLDVNNEKTMFFHPMSSFREFAVPLSAIRDKKTSDTNSDKFVPVGKPRAKDYGHSSGSAIDKNGVMFFNMVTRDSVWCWDTRKEYIPENLGVVGSSNVSLVFPNDIRMDHEEDQNLWVLSNKLPMYIYGYLNKDEINFRILKASAREAVRGTVCDPNYIVPEIVRGYDETC